RFVWAPPSSLGWIPLCEYRPSRWWLSKQLRAASLPAYAGGSNHLPPGGCMHRLARTMTILALAGAVFFGARTAPADGCGSGNFDSTFALIQQAIFETHGCNSSVCHGAAASGGLDLRKEVAYQNLVDVPAQSVPGMTRVIAGQRKGSLLWQNLAAKTF